MSGISPAHTILARAQHSVDRWKADRTQLNFARAMDAAVWLYWSPDPANATERDAFLQVVHAIHRGEGQVTTNPAPLLQIAHDVLDS